MRLPVAIFVVVVCATGPTGGAHANPPERSPAKIRDLAHEVVQAPDYQTTLPTGDEGDDPKAGKLPEAPRGNLERDNDLEPPSAGPFAAIASWLLYIIIAAVVLVLLFWLITELSNRQGDVKKGGEPEPAPASATDAVIALPLGDAEALAREGKYAEAIHTLLLRTLEELVRRRATPLPRSLTSREILARVALAEVPRSALAGLITATELCWFGDEAPGAEDYQRCVERFRVFAAAYVTSVSGAPPPYGSTTATSVPA